MRKHLRWLVPVIAAAALGGFAYLRMEGDRVEVTVKDVERGTVEKVVANTRAGTVNACRRARLSPSIGGQIAKLPIEEGDRVEAGDLLLEIWNEDLRAQLSVAEEEVAVARAEAEAACFNAAEARRQAERIDKLFRSSAGSEEEADAAATRARSLTAQCEAARVAVKRNLARMALAAANLRRSRLTAPFAGVIAKIEGELNEYVTPSPVGVQTPPAVDLIENDCFYISAPIDEVDGAEIRIGMEARVSLDAFGDRVFSGRVRRIAPFVLDLEKQARTVDVEVALEEADYALLLAGYSADVEIIIERRDDTLKVPTEAVVETDSVYVLDEEEGLVRRVTFTPGLRNWAFTEAVSGLRQEQQVVVSIDRPGLTDGARAVAAGEGP